MWERNEFVSSKEIIYPETDVDDSFLSTNIIQITSFMFLLSGQQFNIYSVK